MKITNLRLRALSNYQRHPFRFATQVISLVTLVVGLITATYLVQQKTGLFTKAAPNEARYYFEPSTYSVSSQEEFWAKLWIDTCTGTSGCTGVSAANVTLRYDPSLLQVINSQGNPASSVTLGDYLSGQRLFTGWAENVVDSAQGEIRVSGYSADLSANQKTQPFSGKGVFISIRFKMLGGSGTTAQITYDYTPYTDQANKGKDGSSIFWAQSASEDILNLGSSANPVALRASVGTANVATLSLARVGTSSLNIGDTFDVRILVNSAQIKTVATDAVITYPPQLLAVVDANNNLYGVQITPGTIYETYTYAYSRGVDTTNGIIDLSGYTLTGTDPLSNSLFATIRFRVLSQGNAALNFSFIPGRTDESNILEYQPGVDINQAKDVLNSVQNLSLSLGSASASTPTPTPKPASTPTPTPKPISTPTATPVACNDRWDFDHNCCVNGADVSMMVARWGPITQDSNRFVDLDSNSKVNGADISILVAHWGGACR